MEAALPVPLWMLSTPLFLHLSSSAFTMSCGPKDWPISPRPSAGEAYLVPKWLFEHVAPWIRRVRPPRVPSLLTSPSP